MADLSIGNITPTSSTIIDKTYSASAAISQGIWVYVNNSGLLAAGDCTADASSEVLGITLNTTTAANQPQAVATGGQVESSGTPFTEGNICILSEAGAMCPQTDLAATEYAVTLGSAVTTAAFDIKIHKAGGQLSA